MGILRRLRGAVGNALVWGATWFGTGLAALSTMHLTGLLPVTDPWRFILLVSVNIGVSGFFVGSAFSGFLRLAYRGKSILEIRASRFALAGAVLAGMFSPAVSLLARGWMGIGVTLGGLIAGSFSAAILGGLTAGGTLKLAQRATRKLSRPAADELEAEQDEVMALLGGDE